VVLRAGEDGVELHRRRLTGFLPGHLGIMTNPAAQPRRVFLASLVLLALAALVVLLYTGHLLAAVLVGVVAVGLLVAGARPRGSS